MPRKNQLPLKFRNQLRGSPTPLVVLSTFRRTLERVHLPALVGSLSQIPYKGQSIASAMFPTHLSGLGSLGEIYEIALAAREVQWAAYLIVGFSPKISAFLKYKNLYETGLLTGDFKLCARTLDALESQLGVSLWLIEARIALLQTEHGLESQKAYSKSIRDQTSNLVSFITFYLSQRNEETTNALRFGREFEARLREWKLTGDLRSYLAYKITGRWETESADLAGILHVEGTFSVIDLYETFLRLAMRSAAERSSLWQEFLSGLSLIRDRIHDCRITKTLFLLNPGFVPEGLEKTDIAAQDEIVQGNPERAMTAALARLLDKPNDLPNLLILLRSTDSLERVEHMFAGVSARIAEHGFRLINKAIGFDGAFHELLRLSLNLGFTSFGPGLEAFVWQEISSNPTPNRTNGLVAWMSEPYLEISTVRLFDQISKSAYAALLLKKYGPTSGVAAALAAANVDTSHPELHSALQKCDPDYRIYIDIERLLSSSLFEEALTQAKILRKSNSKEFQRAACRTEAFCLVELKHLEEAIDFIAVNCIHDSSLVHILPLKQCVDRLDKPTRRQLAHKLSVPILLDFFSRFKDDGRDNIKAYAYEDFLIAKQLERPSELRRLSDTLDRSMLIYYLRNICIPEVMQNSAVFRASRELQDERLAVCALLIELDEANSKEYEAEIREITRAQIIQRGVRHVEQSKIFVDLPAVRKWADRNLKESFLRFQGLRNAVLTGESKELNLALKSVFSGKASHPPIFELPKNEAADLLLGIIKSLVTECFVSPEHGLDCYLSMRIRHGALAGQLRAPLEDERIITHRDDASGMYKSNDFWLNRLGGLDEYEKTALDARLQDFSRKYDEFVDHFANDYVQVLAPEKPSGLFKFTFSMLDLVRLVEQIKIESTFEMFVDWCFDFFWKSIESCLHDVRLLIDKHLKSSLNQMFLKLQSDVAASARTGATQDLDHAIREAQTKAQQSLEDVKDWFRRTQPSQRQRFSFEDLVRIGLQFVKKAHHDFDPQLEFEYGILPELIELDLFSDMFFIIFDNIRRHSGNSIDPRVDISAQRTSGGLNFRITSDVVPGPRVAESIEKVQKIKRMMADGLYHPAVRSEGGTGLFKLHNILRPEAPGDKRVDFGFCDDGRFFVSVNVQGVMVRRAETIGAGR